MMPLRVRILPVTIFVATLMLTVKLGGIWRGLESGDGIAVATLNAQESEPAADTEAPDDVADGQLLPEDTESLLEDDATVSETGTMTQSELDVLQLLRDRREALDARARDIDMRENMVKAAEHALESRIEDWKRLKTEVEALLAQFDNDREEDLARLANYYDKMKSKDAARIFNTLELPTLIGIVERLKDAKAAEIIGAMDTDAARILTTELVHRRQRPSLVEAEADVESEAVAEPK